MALRSTPRTTAAFAGVVGLSLLVTACGGSSSDTAATAAGSAPGASKPECAAYTQYGNLTGKTVTVYTSIVAPEDAAHMASYKPFEDCTGAKISYEGSKEFEAQLLVRAQSGNAPDIAYFPQPGLLKTVVDKVPDAVKAAPEGVVKNVEANFDKGWKQYGTVNDKFYAAPLGSNVKSFVWYSPKAFTKAGYAIPKTWDEMTALSDKIAATGVKPWCAGISSGDATGWPVTDWVEDVMLRMESPEVYDQWVKHEIPFNDPQVKEVVQAVADIWFKDGYVLQARDEIATTSFADAGKPLLDGECFLHRQANFYAANWEDEGAAIGPDADVNAFYLPPMNDQFGKPVLGAGTYAVALNDKPETLAMMRYLASTEYIANRIAAKKGGFLSANKNQDTSLYGTDIERTFAQILAEGSPFRFDASDLMPGAVGAGSFWKDGTSFITGAEDIDTMLNNIEASWPK